MYKREEFIFSPTKKFIFTTKPRNITMKPKYTKQKLAPNQIHFTTFHPVQPLQRFGKAKIYNTGIDPPKVFSDFCQKDSDKPYKRFISPIITRNTQYIPTSPLKWGVGCTKSCHREKLVPKYDPYKEYNFLDKKRANKIIGRNSNNTSYENNKSFEKTYLPTDHISIREPKLSRTIDNDNISLFPFLKIKSQFNTTSDSNSFWVPRNNANKTIANRSSVDYNIINNKDDNSNEIKKNILFNKTLHNKKKGIEEFLFCQRSFAPNYNQTFLRLMRENGDRFRKYKGIFTELYDSATKNGNIFKPFHEREEDEIKLKSNLTKLKKK